MPAIQELRNVFHGLESLYSTYLPKVDPVLLNDLLLREEEQKSERAPFYMVEVFTNYVFWYNLAPHLLVPNPKNKLPFPLFFFHFELNSANDNEV